ncbi:MAG TPA: DUF4158 domain-containing protein [Candidatus Tectomicrobia bacterium]|nr:DUF4158 domain-containing protein [Candidatus Tectomicrobia bacterium]
MPGDYPRFKATFAHEELLEHFLLSPAEHALIDTCRGNANRHRVAVLLKVVQYLGSFPDDLRQVIKRYALAARMARRVYPHLFPHQLITYLTKQGISSSKLQLLSGHTTDQSLAVYRKLALSNGVEDYHAAMQTFPVR